MQHGDVPFCDLTQGLDVDISECGVNECCIVVADLTWDDASL